MSAKVTGKTAHIDALALDGSALVRIDLKPQRSPTLPFILPSSPFAGSASPHRYFACIELQSRLRLRSAGKSDYTRGEYSRRPLWRTQNVIRRN